MRRAILTILLAIVILSTSACGSSAEEKLKVYFFYSRTSDNAMQIKEKFLPSIRAKYKDYVEWKDIAVDIDSSSDDIELAISTGRRYAGTELAIVPSILINETFLKTPSEIVERLEKIIESSIEREVPVKPVKIDMPPKPGDSDKILATYFYNHHCHPCLEIQNEFLPPLKEKYKDYVEWEEADIDEPDNLQRAISVSVSYTGHSSIHTPSILIDKTYLMSKGEIKERLEGTIKAAIENRLRNSKK